MGEAHGAGPAAGANSNKAKKKSNRRRNGKMKRRDKLRSEAAAGQVHNLLHYPAVLV